MKIIKTDNYKKAAFEGQVYTPEMEESFTENVIDETDRRRRNRMYPKNTPSTYKARSPSMVLPMRRRQRLDIRDRVQNVGDIFTPQEEQEKQNRMERALEKRRRMEKDYSDISPEEREKIEREIQTWEEKSCGVVLGVVERKRAVTCREGRQPFLKIFFLL